MPRLTKKDFSVIVAYVVLAMLTAALALAGLPSWALSALAMLVALMGVSTRVEFASRRRDVVSQRREMREIRRGVERIKVGGVSDEQLRLLASEMTSMRDRSRENRATPAQSADVTELADLRLDLDTIRAEIRGMRVAQQLMSQTVTATKDQLVAANLTSRDPRS